MPTCMPLTLLIGLRQIGGLGKMLALLASIPELVLGGALLATASGWKQHPSKHSRLSLAWVQLSSHGLLHDMLPQTGPPIFSRSGKEGASDTALGGDGSLPKAVLMSVTDGEETGAEDSS